MTRVIVDRENVNDEVVVVKKLYKQDGETAAADEPVLEIETSKTMTEIRSPKAGKLKMAVCEGDEVPIGGLLFEVGTVTAIAAAVLPGAPELTAPAAPAPSGTASRERKISRAAGILAQRLGVDVASIPTRGWITSADVRAADPRSAAAPALAAEASAVEQLHESELASAPAVSFRVQRASLRKRSEARNLARANANATTSLIALDVALPGSRLSPPPFLFEDSVSDLVVFESSRLLRRYPELNAFHVDARTIGYFDEVNFGITFDSGSNLKVLALRHSDSMSLAEIQAGIEGLLQLYESGAPLEDALLTSSTVTLSDLSRSPAQFMLPLLNVRQSMIIGITRRTPALYSLHATFDHRVSEGLQAAKFLGELRERLQSHYRPTMGVSNVNALHCYVCEQSMESEVALGGRGLLRVVRPDGTDGYLCRNCFRGW